MQTSLLIKKKKKNIFFISLSGYKLIYSGDYYIFYGQNIAVG